MAVARQTLAEAGLWPSGLEPRTRGREGKSTLGLAFSTRGAGPDSLWPKALSLRRRGPVAQRLCVAVAKLWRAFGPCGLEPRMSGLGPKGLSGLLLGRREACLDAFYPVALRQRALSALQRVLGTMYPNSPVRLGEPKTSGHRDKSASGLLATRREACLEGPMHFCPKAPRPRALEGWAKSY